MSQQSFADLGVSNAVCTALGERGIEAPFAIQTLVVGDVLDGRDVLAKSPTGSGKTLAFGVPMMDRIEATDPRPSALILAPTRELVSQIVDELRSIAHSRALSIAPVYGGVGLEQQGRKAAKAHIVVATPGRLEDQLQRRAFALDDVRLLVLDEADRMLDMGFRPAVDRIVKKTRRDRQTLFFSATLDGAAGEVAAAYTRRDAVSHSYVPATRKPVEIEHRFVRTPRERRVDTLVDEIGRATDLSLVFVRTKRGADRLVKRLGAQGVDAVAMHGDKTQGQRERALARFERGEVATLVATDVAARGIDVAGVSHVINFDPPEDAETYTHRMGRTARAGRSGVGITLVDPDTVDAVAKIATALKLDQEFGVRPGNARGNVKRGAAASGPNGRHQASGSHRARRSRTRRSG